MQLRNLQKKIGKKLVTGLSLCLSAFLLCGVSADAAEPDAETQVLATNNTQTESDGTEAQQTEAQGIPTLHIILFAGGMVVAVGALVAMKVVSKRRAADDDYDDEW